MRVTKTIKNYIEKRVDAIYLPKFNAIKSDYMAQRNSLEEQLDELLIKVNQDAQKLLVGSGFNNFDWDGKEQDIFTRKNIGNPSWWSKIKDEEYAIRKERDEKIEEIIITLELGGTKEQLEEMLNQI